MPTVFVLEDDSAIALQIAAELEGAGFCVTTTNDVLHAFMRIDTLSPDVAVIDPTVSDQSAEAVLEALFDRDIPIVIFSARGSARELALAFGATFLPKSAAFGNLTTTLENLLRSRSAR